jgi:hypothetical protein
MAEARTYYNYGYNNGLTWCFIRERIGWSLRKRYQVPKELPPNLLALVRKIEAVESNQLPRSSEAFPDWFVRTKMPRWGCDSTCTL